MLLKLSGEALMGEEEYGLDPERIAALAGEIVEVQEEGLELAIVVGAGNIYRGLEAAAEGMDRATADYAGMLATLRASSRLWPLRRSPSPTSAAARSGTSRRGASSSSPPGPATRSSRPTPPRRCARWRSARRGS